MGEVSVGVSAASSRRHRIAAAAGLVAIVGLAAGGLARSQASSRADLADRFRARGLVGARFIETFVTQLIERERRVAERQLAADSVDSGRLTGVAEAFGFHATMVVDASGRLLQVTPSEPNLVGQPVADRYDHLRAAVGGTPAVSNVVPSAVRSVPVVAFAAPFDTRQGRRVLSGAYEVSDTPLGAFLRDALPIEPHRVYLVDGNGMLVAADPPVGDRVSPLRDADPDLEARLSQHRSGSYRSPEGRGYFFSAHPVGATSWTLIVAAPTGLLFEPVSGESRVVPWIVLGVLAAVGSAAVFLLVRYAEGRTELARLNVELEWISRTDPLTGLYNRRHVEEHLRLAASAARRHRQPLSVLLVDIDHFKAVNDQLGHEAGDVVLRAAADRMRTGVRAEDLVGRWGGEEFVLILPVTPLDGALVVADRLRAAMCESDVEAAPGRSVLVTVSVGCASSTAPEPDELLRLADAALYRAKAAGRDCVMAAAEAESEGGTPR